MLELVNNNILKNLKNKDITILGVIGKGHRGVVLKGIYRNKLVAIKVPRKDAPKNNLLNEVYFLNKLKKYGFAPKVYDYSKDYIIMEYINGKELKKIISSLNKEELINIIEQILKICLKLDILNIEHKEIQGGRHFLISNNKVYIIDFEKAKEKKTTKNLTSSLAMLFVGGEIANIVREKLNLKEEDIKFIKDFAKFYKVNFHTSS